MSTPLGLDDDELASCVQCGLCLPFCPTFRVTGQEAQSPRGRIALMRRVEREGSRIDDAFVSAVDTCVQCRGCEVACPSAVPFGRLMEGTRAALAGSARRPPWWQRVGYAALAHHRLVLLGASVIAAMQRLHLVPNRAGLPARLAVLRKSLRPTGADVWLLTGCVMDAWQRDVHQAVLDVAGAMGFGVALPERVRGGGCCGALHVHAGMRDEARRMAEAVMAAMVGDEPILVDAAGCGAAMLDYGHLLGTAQAEAFAARVVDVHGWLAANVDRLPTPRRPAADGALVAIQDPCHLRHVQQTHAHVRTVLRPFVAALVELDDEGMCCGAGGAYSMMHPEEAAAIRRRKLAAIARSGATVVASANPGCALHLGAAGVRIRHPIELIAESVRHG
ncbi:MAG: (Fe-S)-binding protein [Acidimicrobiales bacterium]